MSRLSFGLWLLIVSAAVVIPGLLWWTACHHPGLQFLPHRAPAEWIIYPSPPSAGTHPMVELDAKFRHDFVLKEASSNAVLCLCAFKRCTLILNDVPVSLPNAPQGNWKEPLSIRVATLLRQGLNRIEVLVHNDSGPPALWLSLQANGASIATDASWEVSYAGAAWRTARLADAPPRIMEGSPLYGGEGVLSAWAAEWRNLFAFGVLSTGLLIAASRCFKRSQISAPASVGSLIRSDPAATCLAGISIIWVVLFSHNAGLLPRRIGFDAGPHLDYIQYIQQHWKLPLADEGSEMYNPPLYYLVAAGVLGAFGLTNGDFAGMLLLRYMALALGIVHLLLVSGSLRLLFPRQSAKQVIGLLIAGFLPAHLYLSHYVTNEVLLSVLVSATLYVSLRAMRDERPSPARFVGVGVVLGLALLTKVTALLVVPFVIGAVALRQFQKGARNWRTWFSTVGLTVFTCLIVCGWHYARVWMYFGKPLVGGWESVSGGLWWQDPGYRTGAYLLGFGESLRQPLFSGLSSFADGIYSTLWGDAYCGGTPDLGRRTPWNYQAMAAGYPLALLPTLLILAGAFLSFRKLIRKPTPERLLVNGPAWAFAGALMYIVLTKLPCYSLVKAFYGLLILSPVCAFAAMGWDFCTCRTRVLRWVAGIVLGVWTLNTISTYWIDRDSAQTQFLLGRELAENGQHEKAIKAFSAALAASPDFVRAKCWLADSLENSGQPLAAKRLMRLIERSFWEHPHSPEGQVDLALAYEKSASHLEQEGRLEAAIERTRRIIAAAPENSLGYRRLASRLIQLGQTAEAIQVCREGLRIGPANPDLHFSLGTAMMQQETASASPGEREPTPLAVTGALKPADAVQESLHHLYLAIELSPTSIATLTKVARIFATHADARFRNGVEAVRLAERACHLSESPRAYSVETLALAYAEAGRFADAISAAQQAQTLARALGQNQLIERIEEWIELFRVGRPYREPREVAHVSG